MQLCDAQRERRLLLKWSAVSQIRLHSIQLSSTSHCTASGGENFKKEEGKKRKEKKAVLLLCRCCGGAVGWGLGGGGGGVGVGKGQSRQQTPGNADNSASVSNTAGKICKGEFRFA